MNINPIDFNYIDGKNTYPVIEYIDDNIEITSNILNNKIDSTSNILNNKSINYTNILRNDINKLIDEKTENILLPIPATLTHTYVYNSNLAGEIRFFTGSTSAFPVLVPSGVPPYRTKIDLDGKLKIYYTYDPAINLTYGNGWVDIVTSIVQLNASDTTIGITLTGLQAEVGYNFTFLENQIEALILALNEEGILTLHDEDIFGTLDIENIREAMQTTRDLELSGQNLSTVYANIKAFIRTGEFKFLTEGSSIFSRLVANNAGVAFYLGVGGLAFAAVISALSSDRYAQTVLSQIKNNITSNVNLSSNLKIELLSSNREEFIKTYIDYASNLYNISYYQGFLNSNTLSAQLIPNLSTSNINLIKGNISNVDNINCTSITTNQINLNSKVITTLALKDIDNFVQTQYGTYYDITNGSLAINATPNQSDFFSVGGQTTIQGELIAEGKIKENSLYLNDVYISSNQIYKKSDTYSIEQQYPPKLYDTFTAQIATTFLNQPSFQESITINNIGQYDIYVSSSSLATNRSGKQLFNYILNDETDSIHFTGVYNTSGFYVGTADYINSGYYGDWVVIKLPNPIILSKFAFYMRPTQTLRAPSLWKCYGSMDGITFTEIVEASNTTALTSGNYTASKYQKILNTTFNIPYIYIGFCFNKITGSGSILNFAELQIFGKELIETPIYISSNVFSNVLSTNINSLSNILSINTNNSINTLSNILSIDRINSINLTSNVLSTNINSLSNILSINTNNSINTLSNIVVNNFNSNIISYATSNVVQNIIIQGTPQVCKHTGFYITITTPIGINGVTFYKYDIDLRPYVSLGILDIGPGSGDPYRNFKITIYYATNFYGVLTNGILEVTDYQIFMSYKNVGASPGKQGLNIASLSSSSYYNPNLQLIPPNNLFLMRNGANSIDYLTIVSREISDVRVLISDLIG